MDAKTLGAMPAAPISGNMIDATGTFCGDVVNSTGLTIRQQFAMAAMQGILAGDHPITHELDAPGAVARASVVMADALLAELAKEPQP